MTRIEDVSVFPIENGDSPACYVSLPEGNFGILRDFLEEEQFAPDNSMNGACMW